MTDKIKIFTIGDHPLSPSGVGSQTKYIIEGMLKTGKYQFISFGGAIKHHDHHPQKTEEWGEDWIIWPVDGYGNAEMIRSILHQQKPDILWFMTDPRFWGWLWEIENEIRAMVPMVYYHVWDNYPVPMYNRINYLSNDHVACISKLTYDIVQKAAPEVGSSYIPHAVDGDIFTPLPPTATAELRVKHRLEDKFVCFWNNRNARRKQSGSLIYWFKAFLDKVGHDKAVLLMHTDVGDVHGQDLEAIIQALGLTNGEVLFSRDKVSPEDLAAIYNMADVTINIADAEGFGLATLESLSCGTPIMVTLTGGLQDQITDGTDHFGVGIEPTSKAIIGSQEVPYIYEDRISEEEFVKGLTTLYEMGHEARVELGAKGREFTEKSFNFETFIHTWDKLFERIHTEEGSWETRKTRKTYEMRTF